MSQPHILRDLGDGLVIRGVTPSDVDALTTFNGTMHADPGAESLDTHIANWTRNSLTRPHPTFGQNDFLVVEDTAAEKIVSSVSLISQTWTYCGIPFGVGRIEAVATDPAYRRRGLVRKQFDIAHIWSAERGQLVQCVTGIPNYYRQFGYEMCLPLGGTRAGYSVHVPKLAADTPELYTIRPAEEADIPFLIEVQDHAAKRSVVSCPRDEALWRLELSGRGPEALFHQLFRIIETPDGTRVGVFGQNPTLLGQAMTVNYYELCPGVSWQAVTPSVVRYLAQTGREIAAQETEAGKPTTWEVFAFRLAGEHPVYEAFNDRLPRVRQPYAYFVRVADLPKFIQHIAPALEARLVGSAMEGYSGELRLNFYRSGLRIVFEQGRLVTAEAWQPEYSEDGDAQFPDLTFLHILFCNHTLDELSHIFPDCMAPDEVRMLFKIIFPKQHSFVWAVG